MNVQKSLSAFADEALRRYELPGLVIGVKSGSGGQAPEPAAPVGDSAHGGRPPEPASKKTGDEGIDCIAAVGFMDAVERIPMTAEAVFHTGSVSKLFVATAVLRMADRGILDLDIPLSAAAPWFTMSGGGLEGVTLRRLLTHTAGMPDVKDYEWNTPQTDARALKRFVLSKAVTEEALLWPPDENRFMYSNMGYELLGALIAEVSGTDFETYINDDLLKPLGMNNTTFLTFLRTPAGRLMNADTAGREEIEEALSLTALRAAGVCTPHRRDESGRAVREKVFPYNRAHAPSSTLTSNARDLMKWGEAHLNKKMLSEEMYKDVTKPRALVPNNGEHIGLGWFIREQNGYTLYGHEGTDDGFRASFWICPELKAQVIVLANLSDAPVKRINKEAFSLLFS
ncbi:MAG: beta-lactamase family protein [Clostridiales Family XIII bacterium]|jgi:CubicO group peptidase (beta-lactamase class C family)|nr:beta-lactamase family protein [Clostridiales Family XIII bacterium]